MPFHFEISTDDHLIIVRMKGKILNDVELDGLQQDLSVVLSPERKNLIFDLSELTHINSTGIGFIVRTLTRIRINNGELVLCGLNGNVEKLFEIAKINQIFIIYSNASDAKQHFNIKQ